jgi:hypothetical protein
MDVFQYMTQNGTDFFAVSSQEENKSVIPERKIWKPKKKKDHLIGKIVAQPLPTRKRNE